MQAIGNVNALPPLIGDVIYELSDYYFMWFTSRRLLFQMSAGKARVTG